MDTMLFPILIGATVILAVWGLVAVVSGAGGEGRRLKNRLGTNTAAPASASGAVSIQIRDQTPTGLLMGRAPLQRLHRRLVQAYPEMTVSRFLLVAGGLGLVFGAAAGLVLNSILVGLVAGAIGAYVPFMTVSRRRASRQRVLAMQLPEALEFLSRILKAGHSFSTGLQMMGEELPMPLAGEFRRAYEQHSLGQPLEEALKDMAARIESTDFAFFVTAVLIQRQTGGDLSMVLNNISAMIRQRIRLQQQVKAKTAEGRFTGYILVAFPAVMFGLISILSPKQAGILVHTSSGLTLLGISVLLQVLGLVAIRKITTVKV